MCVSVLEVESEWHPKSAATSKYIFEAQEYPTMANEYIADEYMALRKKNVVLQTVERSLLGSSSKAPWGAELRSHER